MGLIALFLGIVLIVSAVRNSQDALFSALITDVPKFVIWAAAIIAVGAIGAIPGLKGPSRLLLGLVITVIVVNNYQKLITGFQNAWQKPPEATPGATAQTSSGASSNSAATGAANALTGSGGTDYLEGLGDALMHPFSNSTTFAN